MKNILIIPTLSAILRMHLKTISLTEAKLILDTSISGKNLLFTTVTELVALKAIKILENNYQSGREKYVIEKAENFDDYTTHYYKKFHSSIQENYESLINSDRIREPILTPYYLIEKVHRKCKKSYAIYKDEIKHSLKGKNLIRLTIIPWQKNKLTVQGTKLKEDLIKNLKEFEELLKVNDKQKIIEKIEDLGILFLLAPNLNKNQLLQLKKLVEQTSPIIRNLQFEMFLDLMWITDVGWFNFDFDISDIMDND